MFAPTHAHTLSTLTLSLALALLVLVQPAHAQERGRIPITPPSTALASSLEGVVHRAVRAPSGLASLEPTGASGARGAPVRASDRDQTRRDALTDLDAALVAVGTALVAGSLAEYAAASSEWTMTAGQGSAFGSGVVLALAGALGLVGGPGSPVHRSGR